MSKTGAITQKDCIHTRMCAALKNLASIETGSYLTEEMVREQI